MGGFGCWESLALRSDLFAAAIAVCGGADLGDVPLIGQTPVWAFHGACDRTVPVTRSRDIVSALKKRNSPVIYTEYPQVDHDSWSRAYSDPKLVSWLLNQQGSHA
jgi:predicted peptidase